MREREFEFKDYNYIIEDIMNDLYRKKSFPTEVIFQHRA